MKIWIADAFIDKGFSGNPAAVCIVEAFPSIETMQNIATEMNLSQTAFVKNIGNCHYHIRWFTPNSEAPVCAHATIASYHIMIEEEFIGPKDTVLFESLAGQLVATKTDNWINLNFPSYSVHPIELGESVSNSLVNYEPIYVGLGENCLFMEFKNEEQIKNIVPNLIAIKQLPYRALLVTAACHSKNEYDFVFRYFAPRVAIYEDPVCGSAHCRLIPYWSKKIGKDELISLALSKRGGIVRARNLDENRVLISGQAMTFMKGETFLHL